MSQHSLCRRTLRRIVLQDPPHHPHDLLDLLLVHIIRLEVPKLILQRREVTQVNERERRSTLTCLGGGRIKWSGLILAVAGITIIAVVAVSAVLVPGITSTASIATGSNPRLLQPFPIRAVVPITAPPMWSEFLRQRSQYLRQLDKMLIVGLLIRCRVSIQALEPHEQRTAC